MLGSNPSPHTPRQMPIDGFHKTRELSSSMDTQSIPWQQPVLISKDFPLGGGKSISVATLKASSSYAPPREYNRDSDTSASMHLL